MGIVRLRSLRRSKNMRCLLAAVLVALACGVMTAPAPAASATSVQCNAAVDVHDWINAVVYCKMDAEDEMVAASQSTSPLKVLHLMIAGDRMATVADGYALLQMNSDAQSSKMSAITIYEQARAETSDPQILASINDSEAFLNKNI